MQRLTRNAPPLLLVALLAVAASGCGDDDRDAAPLGAVAFSGPVAAGTVSTLQFAIDFTFTGEAIDPASVELRLNGLSQPVTGSGDSFSAIVDPGPPLRDDNVAEARAAAAAGGRVVSGSASFRYLPPKASARRVESDSELITGPLAHGRVGDFLLENDVARFIVQDVAQRDLYSVGAFGGNLIDAELVGRPGFDNFFELQPSLNIETVINAQTVEVVNDGQDGTAAIVRTCGPDDILDYINPSAIIDGAGLSFPASADDVDYDIEGCTDYILEAEKPYLQLTTTVFNNEAATLGLYVGDYVNAAGEVEQLTTLGAGIGEMLANRLGVLSYIGFGEAEGVDFGYITFPAPGEQRSSFFTQTGVSFVMHAHSVINVLAVGAAPTFAVPAGGSRSFTRFFSVGDGSAANALDVENEVKGTVVGSLRGCVTAGGTPAQGARVTVGRGANNTLASVISHFVTGVDGCYAGTLPTGDYGVAAGLRGYPYENSAAQPAVHPIAIVADTETVLDFTLPATGKLQIAVVDGDGAGLPARVSVVGFDPSPEPIIPFNSLTGTQNTGLFQDVGDVLPFGLAAMRYTDASGVAELEIEPGDYHVFVSRGTEYSLFDAPVSIAAGAPQQIAAQLIRVLDTAGFVSSDFHVHGINSPDSRVSHSDRVHQFAGEGVENIVMTDHEANTDLEPRIDELGFAGFVRATIGQEITTGDYGHFNAYPLRLDPARPSQGSVDWAGAAAPGMDFPSLGSFSLTPSEIEARATTGASSTAATVLQINHIDSHFAPLQIDTSAVPPRSFLDGPGRLRFRLDPDGPELFHHFPALEVWNGATRAHQREFLEGRIGIWFNHLNRGLPTTGIADTDTHSFANLRTSGARTWTASATDLPREIDPAAVARAVADGRAVGGQGVFVQTRLRARDGSGAVADLTLSGSTMVRSAAGGVDLEIAVQAPDWAAYDTIEIYANAVTSTWATEADIPVLFTAAPTLVLAAGPDFSVDRVAVGAQAERLETQLTVPFPEITEDTWFVVLVQGTDGVSPPMFPVMAADLARGTNTTLADLLDDNLGESGVMALGMTNALYADVDGVDGFQPPVR